MFIDALLAFSVIGGGVYGVQTYNELVRTKEMIANARAQIATQTESRWDILKNMIQAAEHYSIYEAKTLQNVVSGRQRVNQFSSTGELERAEETYQSSLAKLVALAEAYPDLKAGELYKETMDNATKFENNVRFSRMTFNDAVTKYNRIIKTVPSNLVAKIVRFEAEEYLQVSEAKREFPSWQFEFK